MKALLHIEAARRHCLNIERFVDPHRVIITPARTGGRIGRNRARRELPAWAETLATVAGAFLAGAFFGIICSF